MTCAVRDLAFCGRCKCWWHRWRHNGRARECCPCCKLALAEKAFPGQYEELRPGVYAQWSDASRARQLGLPTVGSAAPGN
jgi:hypothetical protein